MNTTAKKKAQDEFDDVLRKMLATPPNPKIAKKAVKAAKKRGRKKG